MAKISAAAETIQLLQKENEQLGYKVRNAEEVARRHEYLANSGRAFENEIIWLRKLVENLTQARYNSHQ